MMTTTTTRKRRKKKLSKEVVFVGAFPRVGLATRRVKNHPRHHRRMPC
jgi:hypothetical protein